MWLINLVENLLSVTRMENGTINLNMQPELLDEVFAGGAGPSGPQRPGEHQISVELEDDLLMADMDARLIVQVVINIVNNAIKYTPEGSHILVSAERAGCVGTGADRRRRPRHPRRGSRKSCSICFTPPTMPVGMAAAVWGWGCACAVPL